MSNVPGHLKVSAIERGVGLVGGPLTLLTVAVGAYIHYSDPLGPRGSILPLVLFLVLGILFTLGGTAVRFAWTWRVVGAMLVAAAMAMLFTPDASDGPAWFVSVLLCAGGFKLILRRTSWSQAVASKLRGWHIGLVRGRVVEVSCLRCRTAFHGMEQAGHVFPCQQCYGPEVMDALIAHAKADEDANGLGSRALSDR